MIYVLHVIEIVDDYKYFGLVLEKSDSNVATKKHIERLQTQ